MEPEELELEELSAPAGEPALPEEEVVVEEKPKRKRKKPEPKTVTFVMLRNFRDANDVTFRSGEEYELTEEEFEALSYAISQRGRGPVFFTVK